MNLTASGSMPLSVPLRMSCLLQSFLASSQPYAGQQRYRLQNFTCPSHCEGLLRVVSEGAGCAADLAALQVLQLLLLLLQARLESLRLIKAAD